MSETGRGAVFPWSSGRKLIVPPILPVIDGLLLGALYVTAAHHVIMTRIASTAHAWSAARLFHGAVLRASMRK